MWATLPLTTFLAGVSAPMTAAISIGSSAGEALGKGLIEIDKNYHEGDDGMTRMYGSSKSGRGLGAHRPHLRVVRHPQGAACASPTC